ncbi:aminodeoxychorismate lyase [Novilysobacter arseniciresistens]|uniref:aminodeoxychorismate lyase n=1 Tax=Novilysobacter arseniciresistens TaxID=1385522 RepID=UPI000691E633|nr:aminodeoxychorismate lyase [Lysobacter arseniciresistens]
MGGSDWRVFGDAGELRGIEPGDRGLAYGDSLFETMRAHRGDVPWWDAHWDRLQLGAARLGIRLPVQARVREQACALLEGADAVLRLQVTRGVGGRGYAPPKDARPNWILARHPLPPAPPVAGLHLRWCTTRLALQPALAGIKHGNRLEQVLARAEWDAPDAVDPAADDGLMCSTDGDVVGATAANLFVLADGRWSTPPVDRCGVAGVARRWLLDHFDIEQRRLAPADVETADAVVLSNAVRGILPVARLGERRWPLHPQVREWRQRLARAHPAFPPIAPEMP